MTRQPSKALKATRWNSQRRTRSRGVSAFHTKGSSQSSWSRIAPSRRQESQASAMQGSDLE